MICIIQMDIGTPSTNPRPIAWIIAVDLDDARRQAQSTRDDELAGWLYQQYDIKPGMYILPNRLPAGVRFALVT